MSAAASLRPYAIDAVDAFLNTCLGIKAPKLRVRAGGWGGSGLGGGRWEWGWGMEVVPSSCPRPRRAFAPPVPLLRPCAPTPPPPLVYAVCAPLSSNHECTPPLTPPPSPCVPPPPKTTTNRQPPPATNHRQPPTNHRHQPINILVMEQARGRGAELLGQLLQAQTGFSVNLSSVDIPDVRGKGREGRREGRGGRLFS